MMRRNLLRDASSHDEASDLTPYIDQLQSSLTLIARAIAQLDKRIAGLEKRVAEEEVIEAERNSWHRSNAKPWGRPHR